MKGWKISKPLSINEEELNEVIPSSSCAKVKITKALVTLADVLRYKDELEGNNVVLGSAGVGVISETEENFFGLEKGKHVYIEPTRECKECFNCKDGAPSKCSNMQIAGIDFDGFDRTIDVHIKNLRKKIEEDTKNPRYIKTVTGVGYKFEGDHQ